jgi:GWxTD domain-containing protein
MRRRLLLLVFLFVPLLVPGSGSVARASEPHAADSAARARELHRGARQALLEATVDGRRRAIRDLEAAVQLAPGDPTHWHLLGEAYASGRFFERSRACIQRALRIEPHGAQGWFLSAMAWRREWLRRLDPSALDRAIASFDTVTQLDPQRGEAWLRYSGMLYERGDPAAALEAAERAGDQGPYPAHNTLAVAYLAYRAGDVERSESLFASALPRLDPTVRIWFDRPWRVLAGHVDRARAGRPDSAGSGEVPFWEGADPDPTTTENEFRLEYWSRVAHAFLLFDDPVDPRFDARALTYVRYGPPSNITITDDSYQAMLLARDHRNRSLAEYPFILQTWDYPHYGMRIRLADRALVGQYQPLQQRGDDPASRPSPELLGAQPDVVKINGGAALFTDRPPKRQRLELATTHARFEGPRGARLFTQARVTAGADDRVVARWLVTDAAGHEAARDTQALDLSACAPESLRVARFSASVAPGEYRVFVSVSDQRHRRAAHVADLTMGPRPPGPGVSDIVAVCSKPATQIEGESIVLEVAERPILTGERALDCYFEVDGLGRAADGQARFRYRYRLQRKPDEAGADPIPPADWPLVREYASEDIEVVGTLRRQFVAVPMQGLPVGQYRLVIRVRDAVATAEVERSLDFVKQ